MAVLAGGLIYVIGMLGMTLIFNVPLNDALAAVDPSSGEGATLWARYVQDWTFWNHVRLIASIVASVLFTVGLTARVSCGSRRSAFERQSRILFGDHGRGVRRSQQMIELAELDPGLEGVVIGKDVQQFGQPPGETLGRPDAPAAPCPNKSRDSGRRPLKNAPRKRAGDRRHRRSRG